LLVRASYTRDMFESLDAYAKQLVEFVQAHEAWAAPVVFALAFGESLAFISLLVRPGRRWSGSAC